MSKRILLTALNWGLVLLVFLSGASKALAQSFSSGDIFVSMSTGEVQWRSSTGVLKGILPAGVPGKAEGMAFDASGNLYVTHWCGDGTCTTGDTVERFNSSGTSMGTFGSGYFCNPSSISFDSSGNAFVGQADCNRTILKLSGAGSLMGSFAATVEARGTDYVAVDGCVVYYASRSTDILRYNVCTNTQMANFNTAPLPGSSAFSLRVLPGGGLLVADAEVIVRLDASGNVVQTYNLAGEPPLWLGVALVGDGTFWATNFDSNDVVRFDLTSGAAITVSNAGGPPGSVKQVEVSHVAPAPGCPAGGGSATSSIQSNFNGTAIPGNSYLWFNANFNAKGVQEGTVITLTNSTIRFSTNGTDYSLAVPNAQITFTNTVSCISTTFDNGTQTWHTTVPLSGSDEVFLSGLAFLVPPQGLKGGINPTTWSGTFTSSTTGVSLSWKWSAAVYSSFTTDYNALGVKPAHTNTCLYANSDHAGTPENFKSSVIGGARGGGGSNWTGSWSGTATISLTCP